ncbi:hypothetical protein C8F01DRAFT_1080677 [Mycena amicta]|nr:hypothetical protein C8F01DRAFT_1080677 [Mycena amicta]
MDVDEERELAFERWVIEAACEKKRTPPRITRHKITDCSHTLEQSSVKNQLILSVFRTLILSETTSHSDLLPRVAPLGPLRHAGMRRRGILRRCDWKRVSAVPSEGRLCVCLAEASKGVYRRLGLIDHPTGCGKQG